MGSDTPLNAMIIAVRSQTEPLRSADTTPVVMPPMTQMTAAPRASDMVA